MKVHEIFATLEKMGDPNTKRILMTHGAREPFFGVKVADLKKIVKQVNKNHSLSLELYRTGNSDAMYLAGLIADESRITRAELTEWVENAYWSYLSEYAVPWVASETTFGYNLAIEWIASDIETIASAGWSTLANCAALYPDEQLDLKQYEKWLQHVSKHIHTAPNRVRYTMNGFVIAVGCYIKPLTSAALAVASSIGAVEVTMGTTSCKVPLACSYIEKVIGTPRYGKKRKTARC